jgi:hypothetical protein
MTRTTRVFVYVVIGIVAVLFGAQQLLAYHDARTRDQWKQLIARELPPNASKEQMTGFLQRHTTRFAIDEQFNHEYGGFVAQSEFDRFMLDRQVQILFHLSPTGSMQDVSVRVHYTGL